MISLLQSASFFLVHFVTVLFERFKLISSDVSSLFLLVIIEHFKLISSDVSSLFLLDIWCHWSRLTIDSCLLHSRACSVWWRAQSRDQLLSSDSCLQRVTELVLFMSIAFDRACSVHWLTQSRDQLSTCHCSRLTLNDWLDNKINRYLSL